MIIFLKNKHRCVFFSTILWKIKVKFIHNGRVSRWLHNIVRGKSVMGDKNVLISKKLKLLY